MNQKLKKRIYYSILISLLIHLGILIWSYFVRLIPDHSLTEKPQRLINVKITNEQRYGEEVKESQSKKMEKSLQPENPFVNETKTLKPAPSQEMVKENIAAAVQQKNEALNISKAQSEMFDKTQLSDEAITKRVRRSVRKNLVDVGEVPKEDFASGSPVLDSGAGISKDFLDKNMGMKSAAAAPVRASKGDDEFQVMKKTSSGISKKTQTLEMGTTLLYELSKYQDPKTKEKYFKLLVKVRDATINFAVIPKEVIFLVDASASIDESRLRQFEQGLTYSLNHLNPDDRYNIIVFKEKSFAYSPVSLKPDVVNVTQAIGFLKRLKAGSRTDVFGALDASINMKDSFNPSYRVLLTDGFPTKGVTNARQLINQISDVNNKKVSIFAFGGGRAVSRYLLDFIAYKNRGWAQYVLSESMIAQELSKMYDKIKDPLLLNLRYHISGINEQEVFPRILPDFFKGSEVVVYGTYTGEDKIFMQVLGNVLGEKKEFIVTASLKEAVDGNQDIARSWAFHKIYHLIGALKYKENNEDLIRQIDDLCAGFQIVTPYSRNFREIPKNQPPPKPKEESNPLPGNKSSIPKPQQNFTPMGFNHEKNKNVNLGDQ